MRYINDIIKFNEALQFINENKIQIVAPEELSIWHKPKDVDKIERILQSYDKVEFTDWDGKIQIVKVKEFIPDRMDDLDDEGYRYDYIIQDTEGNYHHIDGYKPIYGL